MEAGGSHLEAILERRLEEMEAVFFAKRSPEGIGALLACIVALLPRLLQRKRRTPMQPIPTLLHVCALVAATAAATTASAQLDIEVQSEMGVGATCGCPQDADWTNGLLEEQVVLYAEDHEATGNGNGQFDSAIAHWASYQPTSCGLQVNLVGRNEVVVIGEHPCDWSMYEPLDPYIEGYALISLTLLKPGRIVLSQNTIYQQGAEFSHIGIISDFPQGVMLPSGTYEFSIDWGYWEFCAENSENMFEDVQIDAKVYFPDAPNPDLNCDGEVNGADLGLMLVDWGDEWAPGDLNHDGVVDGADLGLMLAAWGS